MSSLETSVIDNIKSNVQEGLLKEQEHAIKHKYCCKRCRVLLFTDDDLILHSPKNNNYDSKQQYYCKSTFKYGRNLACNLYNSTNNNLPIKEKLADTNVLQEHHNNIVDINSKKEKEKSNDDNNNNNCDSVLYAEENMLYADDDNYKLNKANYSLCTSYFLDPDKCTWVAAESRMIAQGNNPTNKQLNNNSISSSITNNNTSSNTLHTTVLPDTIYCKQCHVKIGTQCWSGAQCSCGAWITPSFKVNSKAIDKLQA